MSNMAKVAISVVIAALVVAGGFVLLNDNDVTNETTDTSNQQTTNQQQRSEDTTTSEPDADVAAVVTYSDEGFAPEQIGPIQVGDTVRFENESSSNMWVASDAHPTHTENPDFDQRGSVGPGESWTYTFQTAGEHEYHNHLVSSDGGTIVVESTQ